MANRTVKDAGTIKGTNPQYLVEKIIRSRIYESKFWKEECFALTAELLVDKAMELRYVAGTHAGNIKPSPFLCLALKMLQIQPEKDIVVEFIKNEDFKYVRALGAFYLRLTGSAVDCYKYLEPLLNDYRKVRVQRRDGKFELSHMDEFVDQLLTEERVCDVILPRILKRHVLEENNDLEPRVSVLEADLEDEDDDEESEEEEVERRAQRLSLESRKRRSSRSRSRSPVRERSSARRRRSRSRSPRSSRRRSRSRSRDRRDSRKDRDGGSSRRDKDGGSSRRDRDRGSDSRKQGGSSSEGGSKDEMSVEETNKLRASLGLAPLK